MKKTLLFMVTGMLMSTAAMAQEYGLALGFHQTSASTDISGASVDGKLNFEGGLAVGFELVPMLKFRTGFLYNQRHFKTKSGGSTLVDYGFDYFDVPINVQYNFNEMVGIFGGLTVAINSSDSTDPTQSNLDMTKLLPLINAGVNFTFQDMIGFDLYYERGMGDIAKNVKDYSTFGGRFLYWF
jgi:hypothetical protein